MGRNGGEECLAGTLADGWPRVNTQLAQLGVQAEPETVEGRGWVEGPVQGHAPFLCLLLQQHLLPVQLLLNGFRPLEKVVRDVPLRTSKKRTTVSK